MFHLIAALFAIALAAIIAAVAVFWGGNAWTDNSYRTTYARTSNTALQIETAMHLYRGQKGIFPPGDGEQVVQELVDEAYLSTPPIGEWYVNANTIQTRLETREMCSRVNELAGQQMSLAEDYQGCPPCEDEAFSSWGACYVAPVGGEAGGEESGGGEG